MCQLFYFQITVIIRFTVWPISSLPVHGTSVNRPNECLNGTGSPSYGFRHSSVLLKSKVPLGQKIGQTVIPIIIVIKKTRFRFLTKMSIFDQIFDFWPQFRFLPKFRFLTKISIFDQNFDFWQKFRFLTKTSIFDQKFHSNPKYRGIPLRQEISQTVILLITVI